MMLLGKKVGMTQVYDDQGKILPVTVIKAGPCAVTQIKTEETDGYNSVQLSYDDVKKSRQKKPAVGHFAKANATPKRFIREMRLGGEECEYNLGDEVTVAAFAEVKAVDITGVSKGKGFAGVMKRHDFGGFPGSHGTKRKHRHPGSIASFASLAHVILAEPGARIGFAGPLATASIKQRLPDNFQKAEFLLEHGMIDRIVERSEMRPLLINLLDFCVDR